MQNSQFLWNGFYKSSQKFPNRNAVFVENQFYTYQQIFDIASSIAATIQQFQNNSDIKLTAVFAYRSLNAFSGILGALCRIYLSSTFS